MNSVTFAVYKSSVLVKVEGTTMKKLTLTCGAFVLVAASSAAFAADLGVPAKALPPIMPPPLYSWTGFYIGGNVGGAWASGTLTDNLTAASFTANHSGVIGGATVGYNWQAAPNFVFGIEGTFDGTSIGKTGNTFLTRIGVLQGGAGTNWVSSLAGRVGYAANNWLFYAKGGGGWADNTATITNLTTGGSVSASNTNSGWLVGGGVEWGFAPNWTAKIEYDYLGLSNWTTATPFIVNDSVTVARQINMVTVGINYKF